MQLMRKISHLLGLGTSPYSYTCDEISATREAIRQLNDYTISPELPGNTKSVIFREMLRQDSHLRGLHRRVISAILSSKITITCEDEAVQELVHGQIGYDPNRNTLKFSRLSKQLASSVQFGYACHEKQLVNDPESGQTLVKLRFVQPVNVHEFTVQGDDLVSLSETYNQNIHGVRFKRKRLPNANVEVAEIPAERILHLAPLQEGANYWGESWMESCQPDWILKRIAVFANAVQISRHGVSMPVAQTDINDIENVDVLAGQLQLPALDPTRLLVVDEQTKITFPTPSNTLDILKTIQYHNSSMSKCYMEEWVDIGEKTYGGQASAENSTNEFHSSLNFLEMSVVESLTEHCNDIARANFVDPPKVLVGWEDLEFRGRSKLLELMLKLQKDGMIEQTPEDEVFARDAIGAPRRELEEVKKTRKENEKKKQQQKQTEPGQQPPNNSGGE